MAQFVSEWSLSTIACWVVSLMIKSSTRSKAVASDKVRFPEMRKTSSRNR
jgi:hypothetical protein